MPVAAAAARRKHPTSVGWWPVLFIGPLLAGVAVFYYYPIVANAWTSLTSSNAFGQNPEFVGVDNYAEVFASGELGSALGNTIGYTLIVLLGIPLAVLASALIALPGLRFAGLYRALFFMPYLAMPMAIAQVFRLVFNGDFGLVNQGLRALGVSTTPYWLTTPGFALLTVALFGLWASIGFNVIILSAGLKGIPVDLYEAASLDGAGPIRQFFSITVPLLTPSIFFLTIIQTINGFQLFDALFALMGWTNPALPQTRSLVYLFYHQGFIVNDKGTAAAVAMVILVLVAGVTLVQFVGQRRWVHYG
ncbi:carbohydrate ABC transporter permease [Tessaracoccus flavus]|uniref:carbohydrate ABC transporter permease n=1 Tax=Tessaracoccus flavus TaxID=1610493 RepID=UPI00089B5448|nr:sugar ABC transporter permease [Tessaracoccus flavus]SDY68035.1 carbohydrate ABC transporter membrane protein 1, CUT1 family [Tessaracoccus flavus]